MRKEISSNAPVVDRLVEAAPDTEFDVNEVFAIDADLRVPGFSVADEHVPEIDPDYLFDRDTTLAILAGFQHDRRVLIQGLHGTGKSSHIEQVAARLNWPCVRINLDSHVSRLDLIGKDIILLRDGKQVTEFQDGMLPWAYQRPVALVFDEYDAGRPDVMFVIQRVLEASGRLTLLDQSRVLKPHPWFRMFATANTVGLGDSTGLYHGTQQLHQGQMDRWNIIATLNFLPHDREATIVSQKVPEFVELYGRERLDQLVTFAGLVRSGFRNGDLSTLISPRGVINWAENSVIFQDPPYAFCISILNRCDESEKPIFLEFYQRCFGESIDGSILDVQR